MTIKNFLNFWKCRKGTVLLWIRQQFPSTRHPNRVLHNRGQGDTADTVQGQRRGTRCPCSRRFRFVGWVGVIGKELQDTPHLVAEFNRNLDLTDAKSGTDEMPCFDPSRRPVWVARLQEGGAPLKGLGTALDGPHDQL